MTERDEIEHREHDNDVARERCQLARKLRNGLHQADERAEPYAGPDLDQLVVPVDNSFLGRTPTRISRISANHCDRDGLRRSGRDRRHYCQEDNDDCGDLHPRGRVDSDLLKAPLRQSPTVAFPAAG
jgi:hypothetical protein